MLGFDSLLLGLVASFSEKVRCVQGDRLIKADRSSCVVVSRGVRLRKKMAREGVCCGVSEI